MTPSERLQRLFETIRDEARTNSAFASRLDAVLGDVAMSAAIPVPAKSLAAKRRVREAALVDPLSLADRGEKALRDALEPLTLTQLRDVMIEFNLDPTGSSKAWRTVPKVRELLVDRALARARKGDVFE